MSRKEIVNKCSSQFTRIIPYKHDRASEYREKVLFLHEEHHKLLHPLLHVFADMWRILRTDLERSIQVDTRRKEDSKNVSLLRDSVFYP